ncbi:outer membrane protein assembly factor BamD, partial [Candidatus Pelagibacter bacterium]|nr:outer membrane protein assembly factor BamD [Candidatus Pelagibacter bacterium]
MLKYSKIIIIFFIFIVACNKSDKEISIITEQDIEAQMINAYNEGLEALEGGDSIFAAKKFNEAELLFPQSIWAERSAIMAGYSYYAKNYFGDAIYTLEQFIKTYPNSTNISYAEYLIAICYYEKIVDEKKDLEPLMEAKKRFETIKKKYPNSDFALDAQFKIDLINNVLSSKEMYIAKHYIKKEKWIPAINRLKKIINDYDTTIYVEEALLRLTEIYYKIGLVEESKKYASILGYNYLSGE